MTTARTGIQLDASRVGRARTELDLTQEQLAQRSGISRLTVNRVENGKARVSLETAERLAVALSRSREWLQGLPETVDPVERARHQVAEALEKVAEGFNELNDALAIQVTVAKATAVEPKVAA